MAMIRQQNARENRTVEVLEYGSAVIRTERYSITPRLHYSITRMAGFLRLGLSGANNSA